MRNKKLFSTALCTTVASFLLFSCSSNDEAINVENDGKGVIEDLLLSNNEQSVSFNIDYAVKHGYKVTFDVYSENPYVVNADGSISKSSVKPIMSAVTDDNGDYKLNRMLPGGVREVYILSESAGVPAILHGEIVNGVLKPKPFQFELSNSSAKASRVSNFNYTTLGSWNSLGKPEYVDNSVSFQLTSNEYKSISAALPEAGKVNTLFTEHSSILIEKETEVWLSVVSNKSLLNNTLSYYCDGKEVIAFPSTRTYEETDGLNAGEYIKLRYFDPATGKSTTLFPAGAKIGFVLRANGFGNGTVTQGSAQYNSDSSLNPESVNRDHFAALKTSEGNIILGFEDTNNDLLFADNDCNDILLHLKPSVADAIGGDIVTIADDNSDILVDESYKSIIPLSEIIESAANDPILKDLYVYTKSKFVTVNRDVVRVTDDMFIGSEADIKSIVYADFKNQLQNIKTNVFVSIFDFFSRNKYRTEAEEAEAIQKSKQRTYRSTVAEVETRFADSRSGFVSHGGGVNPADIVRDLILSHRATLERGSYIKLSVYVEFEPGEYEDFVSTLKIPPYTPFIVNK